MIHAVLHHPETYAERSGLSPLVEALGARPVFYTIQWERLQRRSWTAGLWLRRWGNAYYGSSWNALVPHVDEWRLARQARAERGDVVHFLFGEFAAPRHPGWFRRNGARLVGTFHCSARRLSQVLGSYRCLESFDRISVMSRTQIPFFTGLGYPAERIHVTLHGVDSDFFCPPDQPRPETDELRLLLVGSTERDHEFAAALMRSLASERIRLDVLTSSVNRAAYAGLPNVRLLSVLTDEGLRDAYRAADVLLMPLLDCTANNALLESIACGTPPMVNQVGGVTEYLHERCAFIHAERSIASWGNELIDLAAHRDRLPAYRAAARAQAEAFDWALMARPFAAMHEQALRS